MTIRRLKKLFALKIIFIDGREEGGGHIRLGIFMLKNHSFSQSTWCLMASRFLCRFLIKEEYSDLVSRKFPWCWKSYVLPVFLAV